MKLEHLISGVSKKSSWWLPVSDQHGLNPVKVIYGIKWGCFLLGIWHMSVKKQSFVVSWLNLSFQGDPKGLLKSWWFGIMRFAIVACPQRLHSNACLPSQVWKISPERTSLAYEVKKLNLHMAFEWERYRDIWRGCVLVHCLFCCAWYNTWQFSNCFVLNYAVLIKLRLNHIKCQIKDCLDSTCLVMVHNMMSDITLHKCSLWQENCICTGINTG